MTVRIHQDGKWHDYWSIRTAGNGGAGVPEAASRAVAQAMEEGVVLAISLWEAKDNMAWLNGDCNNECEGAPHHLRAAQRVSTARRSCAARHFSAPFRLSAAPMRPCARCAHLLTARAPPAAPLRPALRPQLRRRRLLQPARDRQQPRPLSRPCARAGALADADRELQPVPLAGLLWPRPVPRAGSLAGGVLFRVHQHECMRRLLACGTGPIQPGQCAPQDSYHRAAAPSRCTGQCSWQGLFATRHRPSSLRAPRAVGNAPLAMHPLDE